MAFGLPIEVVSSHYTDLGPVDPSWHTPEYDQAMRVQAKFVTQTDKSGSTRLDEVDDGILRISRWENHNVDFVYDSTLSQNIGKAVMQIDDKYRSSRRDLSSEPLTHTIDYRVGRKRASGRLNHTFHNALPFSLVGGTHFDATDVDGFEIVLINHRGNPTTVFTGPVRRIGSTKSLFGAYSRLTAPGQERVPRDHAVVIGPNTLHRQSAQWHSPLNPDVLFGSAISRTKDHILKDIEAKRSEAA